MVKNAPYLCTKKTNGGTRKMAKKVAVVNNKGGSTKTTTIVNLAGALAMNKQDAKILIFEGDAQGNASTSFKINSNKVENSVYDVFMGNIPAEDAVMQAFGNIDIIPANNDMNFLEFDEMARFEDKNYVTMYNLMKQINDSDLDVSDLSIEEFTQLASKQEKPTDNYFNKLEGKLDGLDKVYDYILFDTPPELKSVTSSILSVADSVIIPFEPELYATDGLRNILSRITSIKEDYNNKLEIAGVLATKVKGNTKLHAEVTKVVMMFCMKNNIKYFETEISNSIRYADSNAQYGLPATIARPRNEFSQLYYALMEELMEINVL